MDISQIRRQYRRDGLSRESLNPNPFEQFTQWFNEGGQTEKADPTAMVLATVGRDGMPSQRTVLLKDYDEQGFIFFTNYGSRKSTEIEGNPQVSLLMVWLDLERQIIINGIAGKVSTAESAKYFMTRPKDSQLAAWVSSQSSVIASRKMLLLKFDEMKRKFSEGKIPLPSFWGGYRVKPVTIEFWQGRENRLHDRFIYQKNEDGSWEVQRLSP